jgi:dimethylamine/trimethylamine dehydrogenase
LLRDGKPVPGSKVVVWDTEGYFMGVSIAEKLQREGHHVTYVTQFNTPAPYMTFTGELVHMRPMLERLGVEIWLEHLVLDFDGHKVTGESHVVPEREVEWEADALVVVTQRVPDSEYFKTVRDLHEAAGADSEIEAVYSIGDCVSPRMLLADAVFDGARLAREIDASDPATPLPFIRERRVFGATDETYAAVLQRPVGR